MEKESNVMSGQQYDVTHHSDGRITLTPISMGGGGCGVILLMGLLLAYSGVSYVVNKVRLVGRELHYRPIIRDAQEGFLKKDFLMIIVSEKNRALGKNEDEADKRSSFLANYLAARCEGHYDPSQIDSPESWPKTNSKILPVTELKIPGFPSPRFIRVRKESSGEHYPTAFQGPIYEIFGRPDAVQKLLKWAKTNGYLSNDSDFSFEVNQVEGPWSIASKHSETDIRPDQDWSVETKQLHLTRKIKAANHPLGPHTFESKIAIQAYFSERGRIYCWDGSSILEQLGYDEDGFAWLQSLAE
jgi:hypothetical protein